MRLMEEDDEYTNTLMPLLAQQSKQFAPLDFNPSLPTDGEALHTARSTVEPTPPREAPPKELVDGELRQWGDKPTSNVDFSGVSSRPTDPMLAQSSVRRS